MDQGTAETGAATGGVKLLLRLEGLTLFAGMVVLYAAWGGSWIVFALLFLAPDRYARKLKSGTKNSRANTSQEPPQAA